MPDSYRKRWPPHNHVCICLAKNGGDPWRTVSYWQASLFVCSAVVMYSRPDLYLLHILFVLPLIYTTHANDLHSEYTHSHTVHTCKFFFLPHTHMPPYVYERKWKTSVLMLVKICRPFGFNVPCLICMCVIVCMYLYTYIRIRVCYSIALNSFANFIAIFRLFIFEMCVCLIVCLFPVSMSKTILMMTFISVPSV